jgi:hypothetical protein
MPGVAATIRGLAMIPGQSIILGAPAISPNGSAPTL